MSGRPDAGSYAQHMMSHPDAGARLRELLDERLDRIFDEHDDAFSWLVGITDQARAEALIGGSPTQLTAEELAPICATLSLDQDLFSCIVNPTSLEVRRHSLEEIAFRLDDEGDEDNNSTLALLTRLEGLDDLDENGIDELIMDIAAHLDVIDEDEPDLSDVLTSEELILLRTFQLLPPDARSRVVEYANEEMANNSEHDSPIAEVWYELDEPAQRILATIALTPTRAMTETDLADLIGFTPDEIAIAEQDVMRSCAQFISENADGLDELLLEKGFMDGHLIYSVGAGTAAAVRVLAFMGVPGTESAEDTPTD